VSLYPAEPLTTIAPFVSRLPTSPVTALDIDAPVGSRRRLVLGMALVTMLVEIAAIAGALPPIWIGPIPVPLSFLPGMGLAAVCGERLLGRSTNRPAAVAYWTAIFAVLAATVSIYVRYGHLDLWVGLVTAALNEELVYRLAIPAVLAFVLRMGQVRADRARIASLAVAGAWFVLLPGHREQMSTIAGALPFIAFAALAAVIVHRSGSILPMAAGHAVSNLLTFLVWGDAVRGDARSMGLACVLGLLVVAYGRPRRLTLDDRGGMVDIRTGLAVTAIDLRDGQPATVTLADGRTIEVDGQLVKRVHLPVEAR
jgi:hypothetical protein